MVYSTCVCVRQRGDVMQAADIRVVWGADFVTLPMPPYPSTPLQIEDLVDDIGIGFLSGGWASKLRVCVRRAAWAPCR